MSLVTAFKQNDKVVMMCDSLTIAGETLTEIVDEHLFKIQKFGNILVGSVGTVQNIRALIAHKEWFDTKGEKFDKEFICKNIVPKLMLELAKTGLFNANKPLRRNKATISMACEDRLYLLTHDFQVFEIDDCLAIGYTEPFAKKILVDAKVGEEKEAMLEALRLSSKLSGMVREPFYLIDTKNLEYEKIDK